MKYLQKTFFFLSILLFTSQLLQSTIPDNIQDGDIVKIMSYDGKFLEMPQQPNEHGQYLAKFKDEKIGEKSQEFKVWTGYNRSVLIFVGAKNNSYSENYTLKGTVFMPSTYPYFGNYRILQLIPKPDTTNTYALYNEQSDSYKNKTVQGGIEDITSDFNSLPNSAFFTIEKIEQQAADTPEPNPTSPPFSDGDFVTIRNAFGKYLQCSFNASNNTSQAQFVYTRVFMKPQILMIKKDPNNTNNIYFLGTIKNQRFQEDSNKNIIININPTDYSGQNAAVMYDPAHYSKFIVGQRTPGTGSIYQLFASRKPNFFALKKISNGKFKIANDSWPLSDSYHTYNQLTNAHLFEIKKVNANIVQSNNSQQTQVVDANLQDGFYRIKNIETGKYMTILSENLDDDYQRLGSVALSLRFSNPTNDATQLFKITKDTDGWYKILGSLNGVYQAPNGRILDSGSGIFYFYKDTNFGNYGFRKIRLTKKLDVEELFINVQKSGDKKYGVDDQNRLVQNATNNKFIFEKITSGTTGSGSTQTGSNSSETIAKLQETISQMQTTINLNDQTIKRLRQEIEKLNAQLSSSYQGRGTSSYSRQTGYRASGNIRGSQTTRLNTGYRRSNTTRGRAPAARGRASAGRGYSRTRNIR